MTKFSQFPRFCLWIESGLVYSDIYSDSLFSSLERVLWQWQEKELQANVPKVPKNGMTHRVSKAAAQILNILIYRFYLALSIFNNRITTDPGANTC